MRGMDLTRRSFFLLPFAAAALAKPLASAHRPPFAVKVVIYNQDKFLLSLGMKRPGIVSPKDLDFAGLHARGAL